MAMKTLKENEVILWNGGSMESVEVADSMQMVNIFSDAYENDIYCNADVKLVCQRNYDSPVLIYSATMTDRNVEDMKIVGMCSQECWQKYGWGWHSIYMRKQNGNIIVKEG